MLNLLPFKIHILISNQYFCSMYFDNKFFEITKFYLFGIPHLTSVGVVEFIIVLVIFNCPNLVYRTVIIMHAQ